MGSQPHAGPTGARATSGVVSRRSPLPVAETVDRLASAIRAADATLFVVVDHSGEAQRVGMDLRDTKLLVFGNPAGGTPAMAWPPSLPHRCRRSIASPPGSPPDRRGAGPAAHGRVPRTRAAAWRKAAALRRGAARSSLGLAGP